MSEYRMIETPRAGKYLVHADDAELVLRKMGNRILEPFPKNGIILVAEDFHSELSDPHSCMSCAAAAMARDAIDRCHGALVRPNMMAFIMGNARTGSIMKGRPGQPLARAIRDYDKSEGRIAIPAGEYYVGPVRRGKAGSGHGPRQPRPARIHAANTGGAFRRLHVA